MITKMFITNLFYDLKYQLFIYKNSGQAFEDKFCEIMKADDDNFQKIKAYGNIGDRKCDGLNNSTNEYFQCYAPYDLTNAVKNGNAKEKIEKDIKGIKKYWSNINKIYYVINDKFIGIPPQIIKLLAELNKTSTVKIELFSMEKLKNICLSLEEKKIQEILGYYPDLSTSKNLVKYEVITEIIQYIDKNIEIDSFNDNLIVPDFEAKIAHNKLNSIIGDYLRAARHSIFLVEKYFDSNSSSNKEKLKNQFKKIYCDALKIIPKKSKNFNDLVFLYMLENICYSRSISIVFNAFILLATFFESCDIFEEPK